MNLREHRGASVCVGLLTWVLSAAIVVVVLYTPTGLQQVHQVPAALALEANAFATLMLTLGCILVGWASDRVGTRVVMLVGWGGLLLTSYLFYTGLTPVILTVWLQRDPMAPAHYVGALAALGLVLALLPMASRGHPMRPAAAAPQ